MRRKVFFIKAFVLSLLIGGLGSFWGANTVYAQTNDLLDLKNGYLKYIKSNKLVWSNQ